MTDFKTTLISLLEDNIPDLRDKIQAGAVDAQTAVPYAAFSTPEETPIRTMNGIAGYVTTFELSVYHSKLAEAEKLKHRVIATLEGAELGKQKCYYRSGEYAFYPDCNLHGYNLTFRII